MTPTATRARRAGAATTFVCAATTTTTRSRSRCCRCCRRSCTCPPIRSPARQSRGRRAARGRARRRAARARARRRAADRPAADRSAVRALERGTRQAAVVAARAARPADSRERSPSCTRGRPSRGRSSASPSRSTSRRATLARRFTELVGEPPLAYLTRWRMDLAARRLRETDRPVEAIAHGVGYTSEYAFNRAFTRMRDEAPGRDSASTRCTPPHDDRARAPRRMRNPATLTSATRRGGAGPSISRGAEDLLEALEVLAVRAPHRARHQRRGDLREARTARRGCAASCASRRSPASSHV